MHVINLEGNEYPLQATTTNDYELNGDRFLSFRILPSKVNELFIHDIAEMWEVVDLDGIKHKIVYLRKSGEGKKLSVQVKAIPKIYDDLDSQRIYERYDQHMTAQACFALIFDGSGYNFVLVDSFDAVQWEGFGEGDTRLTLFKNALNRYGAEFRIEGNTVYIEKVIGRDTQFQYRYRLNASNIAQENDATAYYTYAKGYGDYGDGEGGEDWRDAKLIREYTSPIASILGIREAPPIKNGNITTVETMDEQLKTLVDESLKISVSATIHDLRKQGYALAQPELGDRVFLIDERIGLDAEVRVVDMSITRNWKGEVIDLSLTFGTPGLVKRHQSNLQSAIQNITGLLEGRVKLPFNALDEAVKSATQALKSAETELEFNNGILAIDPNNPNNIVIFNSAGIGISNDGGNTFSTAMTGAGMVADVITSGALRTNNATIIGEENYFFWDGNSLQAINPSDIRKYVKLDSSGLYIARGAIKIERHDGAVFMENGIANVDFNVDWGSPDYTGAGVSRTSDPSYYYRTHHNDYRFMTLGFFTHTSRYLRVRLGILAPTAPTSIDIKISEFGNPSGEIWSGSYMPRDYDTIDVTLDLGIPDMTSRKGIYIQFKSSHQDVNVYLRRQWSYKHL